MRKFNLIGIFIAIALTVSACSINGASEINGKNTGIGKVRNVAVYNNNGKKVMVLKSKSGIKFIVNKANEAALSSAGETSKNKTTVPAGSKLLYKYVVNEKKGQVTYDVYDTHFVTIHPGSDSGKASPSVYTKLSNPASLK